MTKEQIQTYEYCNKYLSDLRAYKEKLPYSFQKFGCGSQSPAIEHQLERYHRKMYDDTLKSIEAAIYSVEKIIEAL